MNDEAASKVASESLKKMVTGWSPGLYRWVNDRRLPKDLFSSKSVEMMTMTMERVMEMVMVMAMMMIMIVKSLRRDGLS